MSLNESGSWEGWCVTKERSSSTLSPRICDANVALFPREEYVKVKSALDVSLLPHSVFDDVGELK